MRTLVSALMLAVVMLLPTQGDSRMTDKGLFNGRPNDVAIDEKHNRLFVADGHRVLIFDSAHLSEKSKPTHWLGTKVRPTVKPEKSSPSQMWDTKALAYDAVHDRLFVIDEVRVMVFDTSKITDGMNAVAVIGQPDFSSAVEVTALPGFNFAGALAYDPKRDRLFVACSEMAHVLVYDVSKITPAMPPIMALGRKKLMTKEEGPRMMTPEQHRRSNIPGVPCIREWFPGCGEKPDDTARWIISYPYGLAFDTVHDRLYVADRNMDRVMIFDASALTTGAAATHVLGQKSLTAEPARNTPSASNLITPDGLSHDARRDRLFVADNGNNRVLVFDTSKLTNGASAVAAIGQPDFQSNARLEFLQPGTSTQFATLGHLTHDSAHARLIAVDGDRLMVFDTSTISNGQEVSFCLR